VVVRDAAPTRTQVEATFAEADRRAALRRQHDIKSTITGYELLTNPFQYQDPVMIFEGARFRVRGLMEGTNGLGARIQVPHVEYVSVRESRFSR